MYYLLVYLLSTDSIGVIHLLKLFGITILRNENENLKILKLIKKEKLKSSLGSVNG